MKKLFVVSCLLLVLLSGCGYTNKTLIASGAKTIYIQTFRNGIDITKEVSIRQKYNVYKPFLEVKVTDAVIKRFVYDGNLKVAGAESADLILEGEVTNYLRQPLKYADSKEIEEYRLNVTVSFTLKDARQGEAILQQEGLTADTSYFVTGKSAKSEDAALDTLLEDLARRVASRVIHQW